MSDDRLHDAISRASKADSLLKDELLTEAFASLEAAYIQAWRLTRPEDGDAREKLYLAVNVIGKLKQHLQSIVSNGKLADAELKELIDAAERKKRFGIL